jgi:hypothetical protein
MYQRTAKTLCLILNCLVLFAESLAKTAADPSAHLFPTSPPVIIDNADQRQELVGSRKVSVWWQGVGGNNTAEGEQYLMENKRRTVERTNHGIFKDCFGAAVDRGSPLEDMIYSGAKICWQTLCAVPNAGDDEETNDANARYSSS